MILAIVLVSLALLLGTYYCYRVAFYAPPRKPTDPVVLPEGAAYEVFHEKMRYWIKETENLPVEELQITSFDGLKLHGRFFEYAPGAPVELMFHGYRGDPQRDLSGGVQRCFACGRSALVVDQRGCGQSEGRTITFGILESRDCLSWLDYAIARFPERKFILTGISMGAATVVMAAGRELPENVIGVLADCGYNSAKDIIIHVMGNMGFPKFCYPLVKLAARIFGGFDPEENSPEEAVKHCPVPVIFYHGEADDYVPCPMSRIVYDNCPTRKRLVTVPGAGHALAYAVDPKTYLATLRDFFGPEASAN